jgi:hypothetical protein
MEPYFEYLSRTIAETNDWRVKEAFLQVLEALSYRIMDNK